MADIRVTRLSTQVAGQHDGGELRTTRVAADVAGKIATSEARVTRNYALVAGTAANTDYLQMSDMRVQVATTGTGGLRRYTSELGTQFSSMGTRSMVLGLPPFHNGIAPPAIYSVTGSDTVAFTQSADIGALPIVVTGNNTLTFTQSATVNLFKDLTGDDTLTFTQSGSRNVNSALTGSNSLTFTESASRVGVQTLTGSNTLTFTQTNARTGSAQLTGADTLTFTQSGTINKTVGLTGVDTLTLTQTNSRLVPGGGLTVTATSNLNLTQTNERVRARIRTADDTLTLAQSSVMHEVDFGVQNLVLTESAVGNTVRSLTASNTMQLKHGFSAVQFRDGLPVVGVGQCDATKIYAPYQGGGANSIRPIQPSLNRKEDVIFYYPVGAVSAATTSLTLRTPNFGDRDRNQFNRINRESRGGSLQVYRDPKWPKIRSLVMDYSGVKDSEVDGIIKFLEDTLGLEISFRDWNSRVWTGIVTTPEAEVVRTGTNRNDINITMEVTDSGLNLQAGNKLTFTQATFGEVL